MSRIRYKAKQNVFKKEFEEEFNSDFPKVFRSLEREV